LGGAEAALCRLEVILLLISRLRRLVEDLKDLRYGAGSRLSAARWCRVDVGNLPGWIRTRRGLLVVKYLRPY
jgi:hypothetical protein